MFRIPLRGSDRLALSYAVVVLLLILSWLVAITALSTVRTGLQTIVLKQDALSERVDAITQTMVDQQSGLRGYLLTHDSRFLVPYRQGLRTLPRAFSSTERQTKDPSEMRLLRFADRRARAWEAWAALQLRHGQVAGVTRSQVTQDALVGRSRFSRFRLAANALQQHIQQDRQMELVSSRRVFREATITLAVMLIGALVIVMFLAWRSTKLFLWERRARRQAETAERALRHSSDRYRTLVETSPDSIILLDPAGSIVMANEQSAVMYGYPGPEAMLDLNVLALVSPEDRDRAAETLHQRMTLERPSSNCTHYALLKRDGTPFGAEVSSSALLDDAGTVQGVTIVARDVSERTLFEQRLEHQALHDPLTDMPNRVLLFDRLHQTLLSARRDGKPLALLLMDLDRFKEINDTFGHNYGDELLQQMGPRVANVLRESDTVARLGGDEFAVLLPGADEEGARDVARKIQTTLHQPFILDGQRFVVDGSIGIALYPHHGGDAKTLLRHADVAMYLAKRSTAGYAIYAPSQDEYSPERLTIVGELRQAIERDQLSLHYQPKVNLQTGRTEGVEALVRWLHPERGFIPPDKFIPLAEHTGLIKPLSIWVLNRALQQCSAWHQEGLNIHVAVNLSARNLHDADLCNVIAQLLETWHVEPGWLKLELTESAVMTDPNRSIESLTRLQHMGVQISIDDFGTGYSSLGYLKRLPVTEIKIDRSFIKDMMDSESDRRIVRATIGLGHDLGLRAVAEGVEDRELCDVLTRLGCDLAQGYFLGRPLPTTECTEWLHARINHSYERPSNSLGVTA